MGKESRRRSTGCFIGRGEVAERCMVSYSFLYELQFLMSACVEEDEKQIDDSLDCQTGSAGPYGLVW